MYVSFWELDIDHDKALTLYDLERYQAGTLAKPACKRIFDMLIAIRKKMPDMYKLAFEEINKAEPTPDQLREFISAPKLYYPDFVRFLIYVENPDLDVSCAFNFNVLDVNGDGFINSDDFYAIFKF